VPIREEVFGDVEQQFMLLAVAAGCLLLMMCANMANVLFARAIARRHEVVTRAALGADRSRLLSQMTVEGLVWTTAGSVGGVLVAWGGLRVLAALVPVTLAETATPRLDLRLFAIALTLGVVMGVACALAPAFTGTRTPLSQALRHATTATPGRSARARSALMTVQVATACVLLIGAALMIQSLMNVRAIDLGFRPSGLLTLRTTLPASRYDSQARIAFYDRVIEQVQQLPGVRGAGFVSTLPFTSRGNTGGFRLEGRPPDLNDTALFRIGTADYLRTLGVELREGRLPDSRDAAGTPPVAIITTAFARRYWPNTSAIGQRIALNNPDAAWMTVIGVVGDVYETGYEFDGRPGFYVLASQIPANADNLVVRSDGDPLSLVPAVQRVIAGIDPLQPVSAVRAMDDIITLSIIDRRQQSIVLGVFAAAAVLLAAIGLYGLIAFLVGQRGREVGIRLALGATPLSIARTVSREAVVITTLGLALGAGLALAGGRLLQDLLYGVPANDARTFAAVLLTLTAVAAIACAVPVRRSIRSGARIVLRQE
jgi:putative ABC transport system permease protein